MRQSFISILVLAALTPNFGYAGDSIKNESPLISFKTAKGKKLVNQKVLTSAIIEYYQQPFRASSVKPVVAVTEINQIYKKRNKKDLPQSTKIELAQFIKKYQAREGRQTGFENSRGLASVLPPKLTASNTQVTDVENDEVEQE